MTMRPNDPSHGGPTPTNNDGYPGQGYAGGGQYPQGGQAQSGGQFQQGAPYGQPQQPDGYAQPQAGYGYGQPGQYAAGQPGTPWASEAPPKKSNNKLPLIIAAAVVVVVGVATTLILVLTGGSDSKAAVTDFMAAVDAKDKSTLSTLARGNMADQVSDIMTSGVQFKYSEGSVGNVSETKISDGQVKGLPAGDAVVMDYSLTYKGKSQKLQILLFDDGDGYQLCDVGECPTPNIKDDLKSDCI